MTPERLTELADIVQDAVFLNLGDLPDAMAEHCVEAIVHDLLAAGWWIITPENVQAYMRSSTTSTGAPDMLRPDLDERPCCYTCDRCGMRASSRMAGTYAYACFASCAGTLIPAT